METFSFCQYGFARRKAGKSHNSDWMIGRNYAALPAARMALVPDPKIAQAGVESRFRKEGEKNHRGRQHFDAGE
jgi:hypothetical protein